MFPGLLSVCTTWSLGKSLASNTEARLKCIPLNIRPCQTRPYIMNCNEPFYGFFTVSVNTCCESCLCYC